MPEAGDFATLAGQPFSLWSAMSPVLYALALHALMLLLVGILGGPKTALLYGLFAPTLQYFSTLTFRALGPQQGLTKWLLALGVNLLFSLLLINLGERMQTLMTSGAGNGPAFASIPLWWLAGAGYFMLNLLSSRSIHVMLISLANKVRGHP